MAVRPASRSPVAASKAAKTLIPGEGGPREPSSGTQHWLTIRGATHNNLKDVDAALPLGRFVCVTGVSGSGKSSLVNDILFEALALKLNGATTARPGAHRAIEGLRHLDKIIAIDQTPIGRTPRSNPATYIKLFDEIRDLFTKLPDAKLRGYKTGRFSFNVAGGNRGGGRCEACEGNGSNRIEMDFLADVWVTCPVCAGKRFSRETLQVQFKGKSIADVLEMDVQQAIELFDNVPRIRAMLQTLHDVGLDYLKLGQPSTTLSGGEAQRIKLARELVKKPTGRTIYVLDEPTTGLHFDDIRKLLLVLHSFVDAGNTVVVIEHNLDVAKTADWIIDLGPEGGAGGGRIIAEGTPEEIVACAASDTGRALAAVLSPPARESVGKATAATDKITSPADFGSHVDTVGSFGHISVRGAAQHNLRDVSVRFPRNAMTVVSGVSGSGKTSFAIDTVFTEGYRRYVESLSAYARQFLGQMQKPKVEHIDGLSPAICIEQKAASKSPRSTVGTITEIFDYMRVLWARIGRRYCPACDVPIGTQTADEIVDRIMALEAGSPIILLAPVALGDGETYASMFGRLKNSGYLRVRIDGQVQETAHATTLDARIKHRVEVVIDRTIVRPKGRSRIAESVEHALALGNGVMTLCVEAIHSESPEGVAAPADATSAQSTQPTAARDMMFSQRLACARCRRSYEDLSPHHYSFNSQMGWCETCEGLGVQRGAPAAAIIRQPGKTLFQGAIAGWSRIEPASPFGRVLTALCRRLEISPDAPLSKWSLQQKQTLLYGTTGDWIDSGLFAPPDPRSGSRRKAAREAESGGLQFHWRGFFPAIDAATRNSWSLRHRLQNVVTDIPCIQCRGGRLRIDAAATRLADRTLVEVCQMPLRDAAAFFGSMKLDPRDRKIAGELLSEVRSRLQFLIDVGLDYLSLHRAAPTLSGGEAQRIRLASQIGSGLSGVLYVLDEPTIGLHPRDTGRLLAALRKLRDLGNTLLVVEHDRDVIAQADRILDFGPRAGRFGGRVVADATPNELRAAPRARATPDDGNSDESLTTGYLSGGLAVAVPANRRRVDQKHADAAAQAALTMAPARSSRRTAQASHFHARGGGDSADSSAAWLVVRGARHHNLRNITVPLPLGRLVGVTGVSGSGKSSLINDILWPKLAAELNLAGQTIGEHDDVVIVEVLDPHGPAVRTTGVRGSRFVDKVINVDQSPLGVTPSSNPATYTGAFDWIRELFARLPDSKVRGYNANRFSFNRPGGRCEACEGYGQKRIEMHFLPDVWVECEVCRGKRYEPETLQVRFKEKSIADVLELSVGEALSTFDGVPKVRRLLQALTDVGLDYVQLGQSAPTLSGGEAQRVKLAAELGKPDTGRTIYILDEPTTGLHFDDVRKLLEVLQRLVDLGNSVIVIEHNLDVLKCCDWIVDMGPEAGDGGGLVVAAGTPERIASARASSNPEAALLPTAAALAPVLASSPKLERTRVDALTYAAQQLADDRAGLGKVGREVRQPWQIDGRNWHLQQRTTRSGKPCRWKSDALEFVLDLVQSTGKFDPTNWSDRASIEIKAPGADRWFMHALTGGEWLIEFYFRVEKGRFESAALNKSIGLKTLDQRDDLQAYGTWPRVEVRPRIDGLDAVAVYVHDKAEIDTPAFRKFVQQATASYLTAIRI